MGRAPKRLTSGSAPCGLDIGPDCLQGGDNALVSCSAGESCASADQRARTHAGGETDARNWFPILLTRGCLDNRLISANTVAPDTFRVGW